MTLAAGLATLEHLASNPEVYQRLDGLGAKMRRGVEEVLGDAGIPVACTGAGSLFETHFLKSSGVRLRTASDVDSSTDMAMADGPFRRELMVKGYYTMHGGGAISTSHEPEQLEGFMAAVQDVGRGLGGRGR
jgi:glutamate-1-semialdehyde 2,1-aminomutase